MRYINKIYEKSFTLTAEELAYRTASNRLPEMVEDVVRAFITRLTAEIPELTDYNLDVYSDSKIESRSWDLKTSIFLKISNKDSYNKKESEFELPKFS